MVFGYGRCYMVEWLLSWLGYEAGSCGCFVAVVAVVGVVRCYHYATIDHGQIEHVYLQMFTHVWLWPTHQECSGLTC